MCLVQVEGAPKLAIGCATQVADGQVVNVFVDEAEKARQSVLEFLLINHPLDCPICDQAGECELQDYVFQEGRARSRYGEYPKRFSPVEDFGGDVLYVPNRCILCTRCVRFMDHVAEESVLNVSERGDRAFIGIHPDAELDDPWAGNVVDLCPVGSLLSKDTLHKARAWELDKTPGICTSCSQGCNINLDTRNDVVVRLRPRSNDAVNRFFMCDHGRHSYRWFNRGDRIEAPLVKRGSTLVATDWDYAIAELATLIKGVRGKGIALVSPNTSNETLYLAKRLFANLDWHGVFRVERVDGDVPLNGVPNLALRRERAANVVGATSLGYQEAFEKAVETISDAALLLIVDDLLEGIEATILSQAENLIYLGTVLPDVARGAAVVLPTSNVAEEDGTLVNRDARVQRYLQAKAPPGMARPGWWILDEVLAELGDGTPLGSAGAVFEAMAASESGFSGLSYEKLGLRGEVLNQTPVATT
jgi:NADH-quinone oxidoreductase subunit G